MAVTVLNFAWNTILLARMCMASIYNLGGICASVNIWYLTGFVYQFDLPTLL